MRVPLLGVTLALMALPRPAERPTFAVSVPFDVPPERVTILYASAPTGQSGTALPMRPGVYDYGVPLGSRYLKLLAIAPGYQTVTATFTAAELDATAPYELPLTVLPAASIDGRLVDSAGRPIAASALRVNYEFWEALDYFCANCMLDGQIPILPLGDVRTDEDGAFSLAVPDARHDPFFHQHRHPQSANGAGAGGGDVVIESGSRRTGEVIGEDSLRPTRMSLLDATAKPLVVTRLVRGTLSGQLSAEFFRQQGLSDDLETYQFAMMSLRPDGTPDPRPAMDIYARTVDGHEEYNAFLNAHGSFQVTRPPDTYDLTLSLSGRDGTPDRQISIAKAIVVHEGEHVVVHRP